MQTRRAQRLTQLGSKRTAGHEEAEEAEQASSDERGPDHLLKLIARVRVVLQDRGIVRARFRRASLDDETGDHESTEGQSGDSGPASH